MMEAGDGNETPSLHVSRTEGSMANKIVPITLAVALVVIGAACGSSAAAPSSPTRDTSQTVDDIYAQMARDVPGFAGIYLDPAGDTLHILVKDPGPERNAAVERAVRAYLESNGTRAFQKIQVEPAKYDFAQLKEWYDRLMPALLAIPGGVPGVVMTDIDEVKNRLRIGVENADVQAPVEERVAELGIPREVVDIEITGPVVPDILRVTPPSSP